MDTLEMTNEAPAIDVASLWQDFLANKSVELRNQLTHNGSAQACAANDAQLVYDCGVVNAYSLDGGASTWLLLGTERISNAKGRNLRPITDIVYFVTAEPIPEKTAEPEPDSEEVP